MAVQLGVAVRAPSLSIQSFPLGKVAGTPLWLHPDDTPSTCPTCSSPLQFLLQVYTPLDLPHAYHRYLYVFLCPSCKTSSIYRCQLDKENTLYPEAENAEEEKEISDEQLLSMLEDRKEEVVREMTDTKLEIIEETQEITAAVRELYSLDMRDTQAVEDFVERLPADPVVRTAKQEDDDIPDDAVSHLDAMVKEHHPVDSDTAFELFRLASRYERKQCIRYERGGVPMWYSDKGRPEVNPKACERCGSRRVFEFQVMPQAIDVAGLADIDFGAIYIYTCENSCPSDVHYTPEIAYIQDSL